MGGLGRICPVPVITPNNADVVGAITILERGHRLLASGELGLLDHSVKQGPSK